MITISGYGPDTYKFASVGKPLNLIDGSGLIALCQQHHIPARIPNRNNRKAPGAPRHEDL
jgi:restriction system protein